MLVFGGSRSTSLAWDVSKSLGCEIGKSEVRKFPDGETYVKLESKVSGVECAVVQSVRSNDDLVELMLMLDALMDCNATQVHAVMPYLAYMRQDKRFTPGEALSAKTVLKLIHELADSITTVNCHFLSAGGQSVYNHVGFMNLDAMPHLARHIGEKVEKPIFIAPDKGSLGYAKAAAAILDCEFNHLQKKRLSGTEVMMKPKELEVKGFDVIILDDIISTGGTIIEAVKIIRGWHPKSISIGCIHGLFLNGVDAFSGGVDRLVSTNTLENHAAKVNVAGLIGAHLRT